MLFYFLHVSPRCVEDVRCGKYDLATSISAGLALRHVKKIRPDMLIRSCTEQMCLFCIWFQDIKIINVVQSLIIQTTSNNHNTSCAFGCPLILKQYVGHGMATENNSVILFLCLWDGFRTCPLSFQSALGFHVSKEDIFRIPWVARGRH